MTDKNAYDPAAATFALAGPAEKADPSRLPLRGDLAHVRLAGKHFVPNYAAPMPHVVVAEGADLLSAIKPESDVLARLCGGSRFDVLDIAGLRAWGECPVSGLVGYVGLDRLRRVEA